MFLDFQNYNDRRSWEVSPSISTSSGAIYELSFITAFSSIYTYITNSAYHIALLAFLNFFLDPSGKLMNVQNPSKNGLVQAGQFVLYYA